MKSLPPKRLLVACLLGASFATWGEGKAEPSEVEQWDIFELQLESDQGDDSYVNVSVSATFQCGEESVRVPGFYDGGGKFKIRFSPATVGNWKYLTSSDVAELEGITGEFTCIAPSAGNHGPVRVVDKYHFQYADGTPYFPVGTTAYQWTSVDQSVQHRTVETLANAPFNKIRMCVFPKWYGHGNKTEPWCYPFKRTDGQSDFSRPDFEFFRNLDHRIAQLQDLGIEADLILFHPYDKWGYDQMGPEHDDRYLRYMIARYSAYRNVWWSMANEYNLMIRAGEKNFSDFDRFFRICAAEDPHQRLRGNHNWGDYPDFFYDPTFPWVTHASLQNRNFFDTPKWRVRYRKPVLFDEMRYEGDVESNWGNLSAKDMTKYFWMAALSGGYGTHGETYDNRSDGETRWWAKGGTLEGESPARIAFFREIMEQAPAQLEPSAEPLAPQPEREDYVYSLSEPGAYYLAYAADAGTKMEFSLPAGRRYLVELIDTWNMKSKADRRVEGGLLALETAEDFTLVRIAPSNEPNSGSSQAPDHRSASPRPATSRKARRTSVGLALGQ